MNKLTLLTFATFVTFSQNLFATTFFEIYSEADYKRDLQVIGVSALTPISEEYSNILIGSVLQSSKLQNYNDTIHQPLKALNNSILGKIRVLAPNFHNITPFADFEIGVTNQQISTIDAKTEQTKEYKFTKPIISTALGLSASISENFAIQSAIKYTATTDTELKNPSPLHSSLTHSNNSTSLQFSISFKV